MKYLKKSLAGFTISSILWAAPGIGAYQALAQVERGVSVQTGGGGRAIVGVLRIPLQNPISTLVILPLRTNSSFNALQKLVSERVFSRGAEIGTPQVTDEKLVQAGLIFDQAKKYSSELSVPVLGLGLSGSTRSFLKFSGSNTNSVESNGTIGSMDPQVEAKQNPQRQVIEPDATTFAAYSPLVLDAIDPFRLERAIQSSHNPLDTIEKIQAHVIDALRDRAARINELLEGETTPEGRRALELILESIVPAVERAIHNLKAETIEGYAKGLRITWWRIMQVVVNVNTPGEVEKVVDVLNKSFLKTI